MKVGDYIRTKYGITQYKEYDTPYGEKILAMPIRHLTEGFFANTQDIIKSSPNIIDLIEVGDYVNGSKVYHKARTDIDDYGNDFKEVGIESDKYLYHWVKEKDIKSIVTREMFESMEYKVGV